MAKKEIHPPFFVVTIDENEQATVLGRGMHLTQECAEQAAEAGVGVVNYVVGTLVEYDRTNLDPADVAAECAKLMLQITTDRNTSSPQCIPMYMYKQMEKLAKQYRMSTTGAQNG